MAESLTTPNPLVKMVFTFIYAPTAAWGNADKNTLTPDNAGDYTVIDTTLSNKYENKYYTQKAGVAYMFRKNKINVGADLHYAHLEGKEIFPLNTTIQKSFYIVLPNARFNYNISNAANLRLMYRSSTNAPSVNQLQNVIDNSSPTQLTAGNPALKQSLTYSGIIDFRYTNAKCGQTIFGKFNLNYTNDYIGKSQYTASSDTLLQSSVALASGSQITTPINLKNYWAINTFIAYGIPIAKIKSNLNLNTGLNFFSIPGIINGALNTSNTYAVNAGFFLSSNISEKIDVSVNYSSTYTAVATTKTFFFGLLLSVTNS